MPTGLYILLTAKTNLYKHQSISRYTQIAMSESSKTTMLRKQVIVSPLDVSNTSIHAAVTLPTSGTTRVTTSITNPDVARTVRLKGNQATTQGKIVLVEGTDILNNAISENVTTGSDYTTPTDSTQAFLTVTALTFPTRGGASDTISVGLGAALGLDNLCDANSYLSFTPLYLFTTDASIISKNTISGITFDGSDVVAVYLPLTFSTGRTWG